MRAFLFASPLLALWQSQHQAALADVEGKEEQVLVQYLLLMYKDTVAAHCTYAHSLYSTFNTLF
jgi:hypothetical protein